MVTTTPPIQTRAWSKAILQNANEFGPCPLSVLTGSLPPGLRGRLYRNGTGRLERGGQRVGHWFDGDGAILAVQFGGGDAIATYRYVKTGGYLEEEAAGAYRLSGYSMVPPGPLWERFGRDLKNAANTSVIALQDKLLALWEGGPPHALTLDSLDTIGLDNLAGLDDLTGLDKQPYSAHPKRDPHTGEIFNFGVSFGATGKLTIYRSDRTGAIQQKAEIPLQGLPVIHDFVFAENYLIFCVPPVRLNALPVLARLKSYSDSLMWQPELGTEIIVVDRHSLQVVHRSRTEPWYQWHFGNGYELPDGSVVLHVVRYPDFQTNEFLRQVATGETQTSAKSTLWELRLDPRGSVLEMQEVLDRLCEFPIVQPGEQGQPSRYTYLNVQRQTADPRELFGAIARFDHDTGTLLEADCGENCYPSEPIYAVDAEQPDRAWILTVVYNGNADRSEVWVLDADRLDAEPACRLELPGIVPPSFHGTWQPA